MIVSDTGPLIALARVERLDLLTRLFTTCIARQRGIPVVGVAGVLIAAKSEGALVAVGPVLKELSACGYRLAPRLVASVLAEAHE